MCCNNLVQHVSTHVLLGITFIFLFLNDCVNSLGELLSVPASKFSVARREIFKRRGTQDKMSLPASWYSLELLEGQSVDSSFDKGFVTDCQRLETQLN